MNVLFLSLGEFDDLAAGSVHIDLMKEFAKYHEVYLICKTEKRFGQETFLVKEHGINILRVKTGNIKNTNIIEKGISTVLVEPQFKKACKEYLSNIKFDLVIYTTPPITFANVVNYIKKRDNAKTYLLLKDIFPQNAVDLDMMSVKGPKSIIYKYFRKKEKKLYAISDKIGCMSPANVRYVLDHNPELGLDKLEVCPNAIEVIDKSIDEAKRIAIRNKYGIPLDKKIFVYGGNLGKPQGIPFLMNCLKAQNNDKAYFLIAGNGTEFGKLEFFLNENNLSNVKLMKRLPKEDYDLMVAACDVGMIFLDYRFTIPNFPSRLLSYMQAKLPVFVCTDDNTDVGEIVVNGKYGWYCQSNSVNSFVETINSIVDEDFKQKGNIAFNYLSSHYSVSKAYKQIISSYDSLL